MGRNNSRKTRDIWVTSIGHWAKSSQQVVYTTAWWKSADSPARLQQPLLTQPKHSCPGASAQWSCSSIDYSPFPVPWSPCQHCLRGSTSCYRTAIQQLREKGHFWNLCCHWSAPPLNYSLGKLDWTSCSINIQLIVISSHVYVMLCCSTEFNHSHLQKKLHWVFSAKIILKLEGCFVWDFKNRV